jgi:hypothetical protein
LNFGGVTRAPKLNGAFAFQTMLDRFAEAWERHPSKRWESTCTLAGRRAHIRIAGVEAAKKLTRALMHLMLPCEPDGSEFRIDIWDENETTISCPVETEPVENHISRSTWYVEFGLILGSSEDAFVGCQRPQIVAWFSRAAQHLVGCIHDIEELPLYDIGKPLLFPLLLWHSDRGVEVIHACLISHSGQGVLFAG